MLQAKYASAIPNLIFGIAVKAISAPGVHSLWTFTSRVLTRITNLEINFLSKGQSTQGSKSPSKSLHVLLNQTC